MSSKEFDSHSWEMVRGTNNRLGEPTYYTRCAVCKLTIPVVRKNNTPCRESKGDENQ